MTEIWGLSVRQRRILSLAWPAILEMILYTMVGIVDTAMVGQLGAVPLAAVGLSSQLYFSTIFILEGIGIGATALVIRHVGAGEAERAGRLAGQIILLTALVGLAVTLITVFGAELIIRAFRLEADAARISVAYLRTVGLTAGFMLVLFTANNLLRGAGDTRTPMYIAAMTNLINIIGDYVLIFGKFGFPAWGATGAAVATAGAQLVGCGLVLWVLFSGRFCLILKKEFLIRLNPGAIRCIIRIGLPAGMEEAVYSFGAMVSSYLLVQLGTVAFAAHQVTTRIESLSFMPGYGFAIAAGTLVGQNLGAGRPDEAEKNAWETAKLATLLMSGFSLLFLLVPDWLVAGFTKEPAVTALSRVCIQIAAFEQPSLALAMVLGGALRGAGATRTVMLVSAFGVWLFRLPLFYLIVKVLRLGLVFVWLVTVTDWLIRAGLLGWLIKRGGWRLS